MLLSPSRPPSNSRNVSRSLTIRRESVSSPCSSITARCERLRCRSMPTEFMRGPRGVRVLVAPEAYRLGHRSARRPAPSWDQDIGDTDAGGSPMGMARYLVEAHLREGRSVAELAASHGVHRSWIYKLRARYRAEGEAGLEPRSRRPKRSPTKTAEPFVAQILALREQLTRDGFDAGAHPIHAHLSRDQSDVPSPSTIWRVLKAEGLVTPQPHKRPRSSYVRFCAELPNECWQTDITCWREVEIIGVIDDHSRLCMAARAFAQVKVADVVATFYEAASRYGLPQSLLSDNGAVYTATPRNGRCAIESELLALGILYKHSRPYHPQTCGKIERFHQTLKKHLA